MLNYFLKQIHPKLKSGGKLYWQAREWFVVASISVKRLFDRPYKRKKRVLFFYVYALAYGGTSSMMQIFAKYLDKEKYQTYIMYSDKADPASGITMKADGRLKFVQDGGVFPIPFDYSAIEKTQPYFIRGMSPSLYKIIRDLDIDLLVVTGAGHAEFPFSTIKNVPIIFLNIFGQPNVQKNIHYHVCISQEVADKLNPIVPKEKVRVGYVPTEGPIDRQKEGQELRRRLGIPDQDIVFGRIGRNSDGIFDPIGIDAYERVVKKYPGIHYLIVAPPPKLKAIVEQKKIPNVHFLEEFGTKEELWTFYYAIDVLAHFRHDGESFGLNIVDAMYAERPIVSHKSTIWNAHLEYLDPSFSFVAEVDNVSQYAEGLEFFARDRGRENIKRMGRLAREKADSRFHIRHHIGMFEQLIEQSLKK